MILLIIFAAACYYGLFRAGTYVKNHPEQALKAAVKIGQALRK